MRPQFADTDAAARRSHMRFCIWHALSVDDPDRLMAAMQNSARRESISISELAQKLERWLWRDDGSHIVEPKGIIWAAACNLSGVPREEGAVRCLERILSVFPASDETACSRDQVLYSYYRAVYLKRTRAVELLRGHAMYWDKTLRDAAVTESDGA